MEHDVELSLGDLACLMMAVSDNAATDVIMAGSARSAAPSGRSPPRRRAPGRREFLATLGAGDDLVHQDRLGAELVVAPGADLAGLGEAHAAPEAEHVVVGADHAETQAPGPRPAGRHLPFQGLDGRRPDPLALVA